MHLVTRMKHRESQLFQRFWSRYRAIEIGESSPIAEDIWQHISLSISTVYFIPAAFLCSFNAAVYFACNIDH